MVAFIKFESKDLSTDHIWSKSKSVTPAGEFLSWWFGSHDIPGFWLEDHPSPTVSLQAPVVSPGEEEHESQSGKRGEHGEEAEGCGGGAVVERPKSAKKLENQNDTKSPSPY